MSTSSFSHSPSPSRGSLHGPALIASVIAGAVAIAAVGVAITLSTSGSSSSLKVDRVTASQAATYARELAAQPGIVQNAPAPAVSSASTPAPASSDLAEEPGIVRTNSPSTPVASTPTASKPAVDLPKEPVGRFSVPGHEH